MQVQILPRSTLIETAYENRGRVVANASDKSANSASLYSKQQEITMTIEVLAAEIVRMVLDSKGDSPHNQACSVAGLITPYVEQRERAAELAAFRKFGNECLRNIYDLEREKP